MARHRHASRADRIGLRAAMADRLLPFVVAAMSFLAALALAGSIAAGTLATHWLSGAQKLLTVEVGSPSSPAASGNTSRIDAVLQQMKAMPGFGDARRLSDSELADVLKPWLGSATTGSSLPIALPAVIVVHAGSGSVDTATLATALDKTAPGTLVDSGSRWAGRIAELTDSIRASAAAVLVIVALVAASVVAVAVRAGLAQRREAIEIIHGLGALDSDIANQFAGRAMRLAGLGGLIGGLAAPPVLAWVGHLAAGLMIAPSSASGGLSPIEGLPPLLVATPLIFTLAAAAIGWIAAQVTVRGWLRQLT
ncbi:MAG: cell division protein FtsX [Acidiphilium sp. 37-67-22]|nr:MAG: cell division protein FtsX [Acidiphilium sp. 37-67-22]HQT72675.1 cell division protein FtsX [Acidiphilium sp.]